MKNILVVGGGIVGITAAYFAKRNGDNVTLVESDEKLGGLLKSDCSKYGCFDFGTHVISKTGVLELDDFLLSDFNYENSYQFNIGKSGNFFKGKLSDISPYVNSSHLQHDVYKQGCDLLLESNNKIGGNLKETLINRYGYTLYKCIFEGFISKVFGCGAEMLANECLNFFDMNRLLAFDKETTNIKKKVKDLDSRLGFHFPIKGVGKLYPTKGGVGQWIKLLEEKLIYSNVKIKKLARISKIETKANKFIVTINGEIIEADELIWTLSSGLLNRFITTDIISDKPNFRKTAIYDFVFDKPLKTDSYYINIYDKDLLSTRITFYQNLQKHKAFYACTVEVLNNFNFNFEQEINNIEQELFKIGLIEKSSQCVFSQCRLIEDGFPILTNKNVETLNKLNYFYEKKYNNITLLGRGSAKGFFMSELLISAYKEMKKIRA
jgi:protoporphyrinogen oxidase